MRFIVLCALTILVLAAPSAHADPKGRTEALIQAFLAVKPGMSAAAKAKAYATLDGFFDARALRTAPIAPHRAKFDPAQRARFGEIFWSLLRLVAYEDSGAFFREAKWTLRPPKGDDVTLDAILEKEDLETEVTFHWRKNAQGTLRLVDASFDGDSLMKDYQAQFGRILARDGAAELIKKLEKRLAGEREARKQ